jgi:hypothetical protein
MVNVFVRLQTKRFVHGAGDCVVETSDIPYRYYLLRQARTKLASVQDVCTCSLLQTCARRGKNCDWNYTVFLSSPRRAG